MAELSNEWITIHNEQENITYCSGHYFGCVLHNKNQTYVCSPHIMYMRQTTFTHGVGHHHPDWLIQRIRRFHYFVNFFKFQQSSNHAKSSSLKHNHYDIFHRNETLNTHSNDNTTTLTLKPSPKAKQLQTYIKKQIEKFIHAIPISASTSYLMLNAELLNEQINITNFLDDLTNKSKPFTANLTMQQQQHHHNFEYNPDINNQDDLLLISELLMLNNSLLVVPLKELYYHFSDNDTSSSLLSIKISCLVCCILLTLSIPIYIGLACCGWMKTLVRLALIVGYQSIAGFSYLAPFTVFLVNVLYDMEYYMGDIPLHIGFGYSIYIAVGTISMLVLSIGLVFIDIALTVRYLRSFKYIRLVAD